MPESGLFLQGKSQPSLLLSQLRRTLKSGLGSDVQRSLSGGELPMAVGPSCNLPVQASCCSCSKSGSRAAYPTHDLLKSNTRSPFWVPPFILQRNHCCHEDPFQIFQSTQPSKMRSGNPPNQTHLGESVCQADSY